jgi:hypothetical protein
MARGPGQPWISNTDVRALFFSLPDMHRLHSAFAEQLQDRLDDWATRPLLGDLLADHVRTHSHRDGPRAPKESVRESV